MSGKSGCSKIVEKAIIIDKFGQPFRFVLPNGAKEYKSLIGSIMTLITVITVCLYGIYKLQLLIDKEETSFSTRIDEGYFINKNITIDKAYGFNIAVGLYENLDRTKIYNDETYGKLHVYNSEVTMDSEGKSMVNKNEVSLRNCTAIDIPLSHEKSSNATFYTLKNEKYVDLESVRKQMFCLENPVKIYGERGSSQYRFL